MDQCHMMLRDFYTGVIGFFPQWLTVAAYRWWQNYETGRPADAAPSTWHEFSVNFLEKFVTQTYKEELRREFEHLCQRDMILTQYEMRFMDLACFAIWFDRVVEVARSLEKVCRLKREERESKRTHGSSGFSSASSGGQPNHNRGHPFRPAQMLYQAISIPPHRMEPVELKELKQKL
uniref:Uncharacterized protein LOC104234813 n=1 Tax=Nicotiana sylvestris TaxID=4096 RepID=A0A1U7X3R9_NICSY|nr:PREDICTED: uncharacterized protein LOC104234813 [Nicotiana sylvestris]